MTHVGAPGIGCTRSEAFARASLISEKAVMAVS